MNNSVRRVVIGAVTTLAATAMVWSLLTAYDDTLPRINSVDRAPAICHSSVLRITLGATTRTKNGSTKTPISFHNIGPTCMLAASAPSVTLGNGKIAARFDVERGNRTHLLLHRDSSASSQLLTVPVGEHQPWFGPLVCIEPGRLKLGLFGYADPSFQLHLVRFSGLLLCLNDLPRLSTKPFTLEVNNFKFVAQDLTKMNGWGHEVPANIRTALRRFSAMPLGAPGSVVYAKLGTLSSLPIAEIDQIVGSNLMLAEQKLSGHKAWSISPTHQLWFLVERNARLLSLGCAPHARQVCGALSRSVIWVSVVDAANDQVLFTVSF